MIKCVFVVFQAVSVMIDVGEKRRKKRRRKRYKGQYQSLVQSPNESFVGIVGIGMGEQRWPCLRVLLPGAGAGAGGYAR